MKSVVSSLFLVILFAMAANADDWSVGQVQGDRAEYPNGKVKVYKTFDLYEPDAQKPSWFNQYNLVVYSRTSRRGEQTDIVRKGNFFKELFIDSEGKLRVRRCGNMVYQIAVQHPITIPAASVGYNGLDGRDGLDGQDGRDGRDGRDGAPGEVRFVVPQRQGDWSLKPRREFYYEKGWLSVGAGVFWVLNPADTNITTTSAGGAGGSATGGQGGQGGAVGPINNTNNNPIGIANNNTIANYGTATGSATGTGTGQATSGHQ